MYGECKAEKMAQLILPSTKLRGDSTAAAMRGWPPLTARITHWPVRVQRLSNSLLARLEI